MGGSRCDVQCERKRGGKEAECPGTRVHEWVHMAGSVSEDLF